MLNLDTHILVNAVSAFLTPAEKKVLESDDWGISDIVLWEIELLYSQGRIGFGLDNPRVMNTLRYLTIWPITPEVCFAVRRLDFRSDPVDEIIAGTSLAHDVPLVTRDARIRASKLVRFAV